MTRDQLLASSFLELADTTDAGFDVLDFLHRLVDRARELSGATAAGLILVDPRGAPRLVASSTHDARLLELFAIAVEEGPCVEVALGGTTLVNIATAEASRRWPRFTELAEQLGFARTHVVPMRNRDTHLGALSLFETRARDLDADDVAVLRALVGVATIGLLHERSPRRRELVASALQSALTQRVVMEQAKGVVAELGGVSPAAAFDLMHRYSVLHRIPLGVVGQHVLDRTPHLDAIVQRPPPPS